jgi:tetratricopeptide (TPR) repeat protein
MERPAMSPAKRLVVLAVAATVVTGCSKNAREYYESGNKYFEQSKLKEAVVEYRNAIQKDAKYGEAHLKLAEACSRLGDLRCALRAYVNAADLLPANLDAQLKAGTLLYLAKRYDEARTRADKVLAGDPKNLEAKLLRANATAELDDLDSAIRGIEEAIAIAPNASGAYSNLGQLQQRKGDTPAAEKAFRQAVEIDPKSAGAHLALATFLFNVGREAEAEASFREAHAIDPKNPRAARALAAFFVASNRAAEAEPYLKSVAEGSKEPGPTLALADYYVAMQRLPEATALLEKLATNPEAFGEAKTRLASIQHLEGKSVEAHKTIDEVLVRSPKLSSALLVKARFLLQEKKLTEALAKAKEAAVVDPRSVNAQFLLGTISAARNDPDEAIKAFNEVLKLNPRAVAAQLELSRLLLAKGASGPAVHFAEQAVTTQPDNPIARLTLARTLMVKGDLTRAEIELKALVAKYPAVAPVNAAMGSLQVLMKAPAAARQSFEKAQKVDPDSLEALVGLVALDMAAKKMPDARARVEAQLARTPNNPSVLIFAARTYATGGDLVRAEQALLKALEVAPDNLEAYGALGQIYLVEKKLDQARQRFSDLAARQPKPVSAETMVGMILQMQGKNAEAQKQFEKVLAIDSRSNWHRPPRLDFRIHRR